MSSDAPIGQFDFEKKSKKRAELKFIAQNDLNQDDHLENEDGTSAPLEEEFQEIENTISG